MYATLADLKQYGQIPVTATADDSTLQYALDRAQMEIDGYCGTGFDRQSYVYTDTLNSWVNTLGDLSFIVSERPIYQITSVKYRDLLASKTWNVLQYSSDDVLTPALGTPPSAGAWRGRILSTLIGPRASGQIIVKVSYTGGYAVIPDALIAIQLRLAWWIYKLREAPMGQVATMELGTMEIPLQMPKDIKADLNIWRRNIQ